MKNNKEQFEKIFHQYNSDDWDDDLWGWIDKALSQAKQEGMREAFDLIDKLIDSKLKNNEK